MVRLPTRSADWRLMGRTARLVVTIPAYAVVALLGALLALSVFVASLNVTLVVDTLSLPIGTTAKVETLLSLYPFVGAAYTPIQGGLLVVVAGVGALVVLFA